MKTKSKKIILLVYMLILSAMVSGCGPKSIFVSADAKYELAALRDNELESDVYYVKNGSIFYEIYKPEGDVTGEVKEKTDGRLFWMDKDYSLIPTMYKDSVIAYASKQKDSLESVTIERFYDMGYSIGMKTGTLDENGYYDVTKNALVKKSDAKSVLKKIKSSDIKITSFDGNEFDVSMLNDIGMFDGLEKDKEYNIEFYTGTYYANADIKADFRYMSSGEVYTQDEILSTKNGYLTISMPEECESGYYLIAGQGLVKYYNFNRGEADEENVSLNKKTIDESDDLTNSSNAQQYSVSVTEKTTDVTFDIYYDTDIYSDKEVKAVLVSPTKETYNFECENGQAKVSISEVMAGKWYVYVYPKDLNITKIDTVSDVQEQAATEETFEFTVEEAKESMQFYCTYEGDGEIWGSVVSETGETVDCDVDKTNKKLTCNYAYLDKGTYTLHVYHYVDTKILDTGLDSDSSKTEDEILVIEED